MKFDLSHKNLHTVEDFSYEIYNENDLIEIFSIIENLFYESNEIVFEFECLGEKWAVFIFGDFSVFVEQLEVIFKLCDRENETTALLDFYEQGINRCLSLTKFNNGIVVQNKKQDGWKPVQESETIDADLLKKNIISFVNKTKNMVEIMYPQLNNYERLKEWYNIFLRYEIY